jgi:hypothetical protein
MNKGPSAIQSPTDNATGLASDELTINEAADAIGVDSFTMLSLIQRGKVNPARSPSGEITVPKSDLTRLTEKGGNPC